MANVFLAVGSACQEYSDKSVAVSDTAELGEYSRLLQSDCFDERLTVMID